MKPKFVVGITGASGAVYAVRLLDVLLHAGHEVSLSISPAGQAVLEHELNLTVDLENFHLEQLLPPPVEWTTARKYQPLRNLLGTPPPKAAHKSHTTLAEHEGELGGKVHYYHHRDLLAPMASGSSLTGGMVVCPCSGGTLSAIAQGASGNLIHRAADVHLKERRKLILVPRETPLSLVHIDNLRRATEAGAVVLPAMPGYYHGVHTIRDLVDFVVARICDQLGAAHRLMHRWGEHPTEHPSA